MQKNLWIYEQMISGKWKFLNDLKKINRNSKDKDFSFF